jgi:pimeloyl-ACP methyl ester carboxylesterase
MTDTAAASTLSWFNPWKPLLDASTARAALPMPPAMQAWSDYLVDFTQRSILFVDVLRQRGNATLEAAESEAPHVLMFESELILDGRTFERPVNYALVRIEPPAGVQINPAARPFIVFDPRAGHGPGIGGMKDESEIGVALRAGHPAYFVGFTTAPVPGQTIEDVCRAEAEFVRHVTSLHPDAPSAPALIGNCQAGWQIMMMAALNPDVPGPILIAGAPLSYWAGTRGFAPLRYKGGMLGGTWMTALAGDLGNGVFDGAALVGNFESMNPANTYFRKSYNVLDRVDTEAERFLGFEKWWGSPVLLNAEEIQFITDNLFVGNKLTSGQLHTTDGVRIDLRNIKSPIVVFCSRGDDITPPPQALGWITDLYDHERDIVANGQTIVYSVHDNIGHLGIFVSGKVATKEHDQFVSCMDMIDLMPPGLYEAVFEKVDAETANRQMVTGGYVFRLEVRTLDHIRALGENSPEDDAKFAAVARVSEVNNGLYRTFLQPWVRASATEATAELLRQTDPRRVRFAAFSDKNPAVKAVEPLAEVVREQRAAVSDDNPYRRLEHSAADLWEAALQTQGRLRDLATEAAFHAIYGSPVVQAAVGLRASNIIFNPRVGRSVMREAAAAKKQLELMGKLRKGGPAAAVLRAVNYIHRAERMVDERAFVELAQFRQHLADTGHPTTFGEFKKALRTQALLVGSDPDAALEAIPELLPRSQSAREDLMREIREVIEASGPMTSETAARLARIEALFLGGAAPNAEPAPARAEALDGVQ